MNLMEAKYKTKRIFEEETGIIDEREGKYCYHNKTRDFLYRVYETIRLETEEDYQYYRPYLADYLDKYLKYYSKEAIDDFQDDEYYFPEYEFMPETWKMYSHEDGEHFNHNEVMKKLVLFASDYSYGFTYKVLNFQFILTHLDYYTLEKVVRAVELAYSIFKFKPEIVNRIIKKNNENYTYLKDYKYLNSYDDYVKRIIDLVSFSNLENKEDFLKRLNRCSKLPKARKTIDILKELNEFNKEDINQEKFNNDLEYLKKHSKALVLFKVEFDKNEPRDIDYIKKLIRNKLSNKNPKKRPSEKVINQIIEESLNELFQYNTIYILVRKR